MERLKTVELSGKDLVPSIDGFAVQSTLVWKRAMIRTIRNFLADLNNKADREDPSSEDDERLATVTLIYHLMNIDGHLDSAELETLKGMLQSQFGLDAVEVEGLLVEACKREKEAIDLYSFTSLIKRELDYDRRLEVMEMLWEIAYSDGVLHELEDNMIWRVSELIGVSNRDRLDIRRRIADKCAALSRNA